MLTVQRLSYCGDNTIFGQNRDEEVLTKMAQDYINHTGMLSIYFKIGRCGHKCDLTFFNMDPIRDLNLPKFTSTVWSFLVGKPVLKVIPIYMRLSPQHAKLIADTASFSPEQSERLLKLSSPKPAKHLGLTSDIDANTSAHVLGLFRKFSLRLLVINISELKDIPLHKTWNTALNNLISFAPLQAGLSYEDLLVCNRMIIRIIQKSTLCA